MMRSQILSAVLLALLAFVAAPLAYAQQVPLQDKPFAVIDIGGYVDPVGRSCFVQAKLPFEGPTVMNDDASIG